MNRRILDRSRIHRRFNECRRLFCVVCSFIHIQFHSFFCLHFFISFYINISYFTYFFSIPKTFDFNESTHFCGISIPMYFLPLLVSKRTICILFLVFDSCFSTSPHTVNMDPDKTEYRRIISFEFSP